MYYIHAGLKIQSTVALFQLVRCMLRDFHKKLYSLVASASNFMLTGTVSFHNQIGINVCATVNPDWRYGNSVTT